MTTMCPARLLLTGFLTCALLWATAVIADEFPFYACPAKPTSYTIDPVARKVDANTFCFKTRVQSWPGCDDYCCQKADLRKIELNVNAKCKVPGASVTATLNGVPTKARPSFDSPKGASPGGTLLRITQLGLNLTTADGAEVCVTLKTNNAGDGCTTLEDLCVPSPGQAPGSCTAALFDSKLDCCDITTGGVVPYTAPPPPPSPSRTPSPALPGPNCPICISAELIPSPTVLFPYAFPEAKCREWINKVQAEVVSAAEATGAVLTGPPNFQECTDSRMTVCNDLASNDDGSKLQSFFDEQVYHWFADAFGYNCPAYLVPYTKVVTVGGRNGAPSCANSFGAVVCDPPHPESVPFPPSKCAKRPYSTPFVASPFLNTLPGRTSNTSLYCFTVAVRDPSNDVAPAKCASSTTLHKAEFYLDDTKRGKVKAIGLQPAGAASMTFISTSWASTGQMALRANNLNWDKTKADGGRICLEVDKSQSISSLCLDGVGNCRLAFFDSTRSCCPVYLASL